MSRLTRTPPPALDRRSSAWGRLRLLAAAMALLLSSGGAALAQVVEGALFEDRDGDGVRDPGEPGIPGIPVRLFGTAEGGAGYDATAVSGGDGSYSLSPGSGCYLALPAEPPGWRLSGPRIDGLPDGDPGYLEPVGLPRLGRLPRGIDRLLAGSLAYAAVGDSIAWNWNSCLYAGSFWYSAQVRDRIACAAPGATVTLGRYAVKGEHTDDLLVNDFNDSNNVFRLIDLQPDWITISMIGNDLLDVEPPPGATQEQLNRAVEEILDARRNLQEALSTLLSRVPEGEIALNTLYDNLAWRCYSSGTDEFHRAWLPIVNHILRDLAWGQVRPATVIEAAAEFAHADQSGACLGFDSLICRDFLQTDQIHPNNRGYNVMREKAWEAAGGVLLGSADPLDRISLSGANFGLLRRVRRLLPTRWSVSGGAAVTDPEAALDDTDGEAAARVVLGIGSQEFRLGGFPDWYDEVQIVRVVAGVRYRTTGTVVDDYYRIEASAAGEFEAPPGHPYSPTAWNFATPLVGGGGPNQPPTNPDYPQARLLATPNMPVFREVSATLGKDPVLPPGASTYQWPPLDADDLVQTEVRLAAAPVAGTAGNDAYEVEIDAAWIDLYGWEAGRPPEAADLRVDRLPDDSLEISFLPVPGALRHNLYVGRIATLAAGGYDHGAMAPAGPFCDVATADAGAGRLQVTLTVASQPGVPSYFLVTGHVDNVESPAGYRSDGSEVDRSHSVCR